MKNSERPDFWQLLREETSSGVRKGFRYVMPWLAASCSAVGWAIAHFVPAALFDKSNWGSLATIYAGIVTFNGITLALTWSAIGKVYDSIARPEFSRFLRSAGLLGTYLFYVSLIHSVQVIGAVVAVLGLASTPLPLPLTAARITLAVVVATTLYAIRWAAGSAKLVQDLAWHYGTFDSLTPEERGRLHAVAEQGA